MRKLSTGAALVVLGTLPVWANAELSCQPGEKLTRVSGKIFNNAVASDKTLGTVHLRLGDDAKMKCGIVGQATGGSGGSFQYVHTFVCDDRVTLAPGYSVHSQLTLNTVGAFTSLQACSAPEGAITGTFEETSTPVPNTGRGIFAGVERGTIKIKGTIGCLSAIDMSFSGEVCLPGPH
jgi:hypothetical protein